MSTFTTAPSLLFSSESVTEGHPDKMCDQISDAILDALLAQDPNARVACETAVKTGFVLLLGEISSFVNLLLILVLTAAIKGSMATPVAYRRPLPAKAQTLPKAWIAPWNIAAMAQRMQKLRQSARATRA